MNLQKVCGGLAFVFGLLLLGRVLSEGNSDTGQLLSPLLMITVGVGVFFIKSKKK